MKSEIAIGWKLRIQNVIVVRNEVRLIKREDKGEVSGGYIKWKF